MHHLVRAIIRVEMAKYVKYVPEEHLTDDIYRPPTKSELEKVKEEKLAKKAAKEAEKAKKLRRSPRKRKGAVSKTISKSKRALFG